MGYQEAYKPIRHLAEAAGIRDAVKAYEDCEEIPGYCQFFCAVRSKDRVDESGAPLLFACVGGDRCVSMTIGEYSFDPPLDWVYSEHYEDLDNALLEDAAQERPDLVAAARMATEAKFKRMIAETRSWRAELNRQLEELRPKIEAYLREHGATRHQDMFKVPELAEYTELYNVLHMLVWEGFLVEQRYRRTQRLPRYALANAS